MTSASYISLARKYRPSKIKDLIGQEALVQTLENAFLLNRVADAFMFTGTRGVGKTTTARIIAKALNCIGEDGKGNITLNPCGVCEQCISITEDRNLDVIEMDAASKTSVDDIRDVIENAKYKPVASRYKIFIIDEVHMLSKSAFNALLKTLEEPASHLKFIFATTELRKVPITILSRCQKFDLKRISVDTLVKHLANICDKENIEYEPIVLNIISKSAAGSVRDALSLLDQAIVYSNKSLTENAINEMIGNKGKTEQYEFFNLIINSDNKALHFITNIYKQGLSLDIFFEDLQNTCHDITVYKITNSTDIIDINDFELEQIQNLANKIEISTLLHIWQILLKGNLEIKTNNNTLQIANMLTAKLILANNLNNTDLLINQIMTNKQIISKEKTSAHLSSFNQEAKLPEDTPWQTNNVSEVDQKIIESYPSITNEKHTPTTSEFSSNIQTEQLMDNKEHDIEFIKDEVTKIFPKAIFKGKKPQ